MFEIRRGEIVATLTVRELEIIYLALGFMLEIAGNEIDYNELMDDVSLCLDLCSN